MRIVIFPNDKGVGQTIRCDQALLITVTKGEESSRIFSQNFGVSDEGCRRSFGTLTDQVRWAYLSLPRPASVPKANRSNVDEGRYNPSLLEHLLVAVGKIFGR